MIAETTKSEAGFAVFRCLSSLAALALTAEVMRGGASAPR